MKLQLVSIVAARQELAGDLIPALKRRAKFKSTLRVERVGTTQAHLTAKLNFSNMASTLSGALAKVPLAEANKVDVLMRAFATTDF